MISNTNLIFPNKKKKTTEITVIYNRKMFLFPTILIKTKQIKILAYCKYS